MALLVSKTIYLFENIIKYMLKCVVILNWAFQESWVFSSLYDNVKYDFWQVGQLLL